LIKANSSEIKFKHALMQVNTKIIICVGQGFPACGTWSPRGTYTYPKGYIYGYQQKSKIYLHIIYFQIFTHISVNILFKIIICLFLNIPMN